MRKMKPLSECANGDGRPVSPPSLVICRECMDKIGQTLRDMLKRAEARAALPDQETKRHE